ncbi:MAG: anthranilate phosphoribosyltransferase [Chloroflexi bacterium]|nr:anthranilate phosphoribosyltransferase [Chloroflexota bacterium]
MIREAISALVSGKSLTAEEAAAVMEEIMSGQATPAQFGAFVTALRMKGETAEEIAGLAKVMQEKAARVETAGPLVDTCGTGGDASGTFNISTCAAFVVAGAGLRVAKHGNRAMSGKCGSADVLEALGVRIDLGPEGVRQCLERVGIGFMFAPVFHPAMKYAVAPRREIGIRTVFNILGPLTNPARAQTQLLGIADGRLGETMAQVLGRLGSRHALVVHGEDGLDEISISAKTHIWELKSGSVKSYFISPEELGLLRASLKEIKGGSVEENRAILEGVLQGKAGPARDVVVMNAGAALLAGDGAGSLKEGVELAQNAISGGQALHKLRELAELSRSLSG